MHTKRLQRETEIRQCIEHLTKWQKRAIFTIFICSILKTKTQNPVLENKEMKKLVVSMTVGLVLAAGLGHALANSLKDVAMDANRVQNNKVEAAISMH